MGIDVKYSTVYDYFKGVHSMNITYGLYKGDFLPYQEPINQWEDFWTGYYSSRIHLKRMIRHVFNDIQGTKTLAAIRAVFKNDGSINFSKELQANINQIQHHIREAERNWSILMHHDAITGTHTKNTEPSYYELLSNALGNLFDARELIKSSMEKPISKFLLQSIQKVQVELTDSNITLHTIVNPSGYYRIQITNFTIPETGPDTSYVFVLLNEIKMEVVSEAYYADIQELNADTHELQTIKKGFVKIRMPALSDAHLLVFTTSNKSDCSKTGIECAKYVEHKSVSRSEELTNGIVHAHIGANGDLTQFKFGKNNAEIEESFTYYNTDRQTRSGIYLFNPRHEKMKINFNKPKITIFEIGELVKIVQVHLTSDTEKLLKTYIVNLSGCPNLMKQLFLEVQIASKKVAEISMGLKKKPVHSGSEFRSYADDSMKLIERPIYDNKVNIKRTNDNELNGYYNYACVHGGMMREIFKPGTISLEQESFFGWANSNPIGCTFTGNNEVDFMLYRSIGNNDYKGVSDYLHDKHVMSTSFQFYTDSSVDGILFHKVRGNTKLNEPYSIFSENLPATEVENLSKPSSIFESLVHFKKHFSQVSSEFGEVR